MSKKPLHQSVLRRWHSILGLVASLFLISLAITGIYLNHQDDWFKSDSKSFDSVEHIVSVNEFVYLVSSGGVFRLEADADLVFMYPLPNVSDIIYTNEMLWVLTRSGFLMRSNSIERPIWQRFYLPEGSGEAYSFQLNSSSILVHTTKGVYQSKDLANSWTLLYESGSSLRSVMKQLHSGWIGGDWLRFAHDISALILLFLIASGLVIYYRLLKMKRFKK